jgi:hypothetical protein
MAIFKRKHVTKILEGEKTQTRRTHKRGWTVGRVYGVRDNWYAKPTAHIRITRKFRQRLSDISPEDVRKEGYSSLEEFKRVWEEINGGPGSWDPNKVVTAYEFKLASSKPAPPGRRPHPPGSRTGSAKRSTKKGDERKCPNQEWLA